MSKKLHTYKKYEQKSAYIFLLLMKSHDPFSRQKSSYYHLFDRFYFLFYLTQSFFFESQWHTNEHDDEHMKTVIE